jgi:hypothetical protein
MKSDRKKPPHPAQKIFRMASDIQQTPFVKQLAANGMPSKPTLMHTVSDLIFFL